LDAIFIKLGDTKPFATVKKAKSVGFKRRNVSNGRGRDKKLTKEDVLAILNSNDRPVWTASQIAERTDVSKTTVKNRLQEMSEIEGVNSVKVGNAVAYYATERWKGEDVEISTGERISTAATDYWEGRFLGDIRDMSVVRSYDDKELSRGDKIQLLVAGDGPTMKKKDLCRIRRRVRRDTSVGGVLTGTIHSQRVPRRYFNRRVGSQ